MTLTGSYVVPGTREEVFTAILSPAALRRSIPGCQKLVETEPDHYAAELTIGIGAVRGHFKGKVSVRDKQPPEQFTMLMDGSGPAGWVKGSSLVRLAEAPNGTEVSYEADVTMGGLVASVGARMMTIVAKQLAGAFFKKLSQQIRPSGEAS